MRHTIYFPADLEAHLQEAKRTSIINLSKIAQNAVIEEFARMKIAPPRESQQDTDA